MGKTSSTQKRVSQEEESRAGSQATSWPTFSRMSTTPCETSSQSHPLSLQSLRVATSYQTRMFAMTGCRRLRRTITIINTGTAMATVFTKTRRQHHKMASIHHSHYLKCPMGSTRTNWWAANDRQTFSNACRKAHGMTKM